MKVIINRLAHEPKQTLGVLNVYNDVNLVFSCKVLELPDRQNKRSISRINKGDYNCQLRWSKKYNWHYILKDVENRSFILIHFGNYYTQTRGCLLVGNAFKDINNDGLRDVTSSKKTMKRLLNILPKQFNLTITN